MSSIETVGLSSPTTNQIASGGLIRVNLPKKVKQGDVHIAHIGFAANSTLRVPSAGWTFVHGVRSGTTESHIAQQLWIHVVGSTPATIADFEFSEFSGEKWVGITTVRYADINALVTAVAGAFPGDPDVILAIIYSYTQVLQALPRGPLAIEYVYSQVLQALNRGQLVVGYSPTKVIQLLVQGTLAVGYSPTKVIQLLTQGTLAVGYSPTKVIQLLTQGEFAIGYSPTRVIQVLLQGELAVGYSYMDVRTPP